MQCVETVLPNRVAITTDIHGFRGFYPSPARLIVIQHSRSNHRRVRLLVIKQGIFDRPLIYTVSRLSGWVFPSPRVGWQLIWSCKWYPFRGPASTDVLMTTPSPYYLRNIFEAKYDQYFSLRAPSPRSQSPNPAVLTLSLSPNLC